MTTNRPLTYLTLKSVLQYMDADARFQINRKCPTIASIETNLPLKIDNLRLRSFEVQINKTTFQLGVMRRYRDKDTPVLIPDNNATGGFPYDVDRFGVKDRLLVVAPGDLLIQKEYGQCTSELEVTAFEEEEFNSQERRLNEERTRMYVNERAIKEIKSELLPYQFRRDNFQPPFSHFIQLTTKSHGKKQIEVLDYDNKLYEAMSYFMEKLFQGRKGPIEVKTLDVHHQGCLRSISNQNFLIQNLKSDWKVNIGLNAIKPILNVDSFPLKSITLIKYFSSDEAIETAQKLVISDPSSSNIRELSRNNRRVHCINSSDKFVKNIIKQFKTCGQHKGMHYSMLMGEAQADDMMKWAKQQHGAKRGTLEKIRNTRFPECIVLSCFYNAEINVYRIATKSERSDGSTPKCFLNIKIQPAGFAAL